MQFMGTASLRSFENGDVHVALDTEVSRQDSSSYVSERDGPIAKSLFLGNGGCCSADFVPLPYGTSDQQFVYGSFGADTEKATASFVVKKNFEFDTLIIVGDLSGPPVLGEDAVVCGDVQRRVEVLEAEIGPYPGYTGGLDVEGSVKVEFLDEYVFKFEYDLKGLSVECSECGIHIHEGTTCEDADEVGGHYWDETVTDDPWFSYMNAYYSSDKEGKAKGSFLIKDGYDFIDHQYHAVVVHDGDDPKTRIGCGQLIFDFTKLLEPVDL